MSVLVLGSTTSKYSKFRILKFRKLILKIIGKYDKT